MKMYFIKGFALALWKLFLIFAGFLWLAIFTICVMVPVYIYFILISLGGGTPIDEREWQPENIAFWMWNKV